MPFEAVMDSLVHKCQQALIEYNLNQLVIAGGVSANLVLREKLNNLQTSLLINPSNNINQLKIFLPKLEFCTDNGAMIAMAGLMRAELGQADPDLNIEAYARWNLSSLKN